MPSRPKTKTKRKSPSRYRALPGDEPLPFMAHVQELRRRLVWIALFVVGGAGIGYALQEQLTNWLLAPAANQQFIYTTPAGGLNFILQTSIYFGLAISVPVIIYHVLRYIEPLVRRRSKHFVLRSTLASVGLAVGGMAFGYFVGLPAAMHFLAGMLSSNDHIEALLSLDNYLSFVTIYLVGSALIFQVPVILFFINRIKPLSFKRLMKFQRWVILGAFIVAAIITPTPDLMNQAIIAVPIIALYQLSILLVWGYNRYSRQLVATQLRKQDLEARTRRESMEYTDEVVPVPSAFITPKAVDATLDKTYDPLSPVSTTESTPDDDQTRIQVLTDDK